MGTQWIERSNCLCAERPVLEPALPTEDDEVVAWRLDHGSGAPAYPLVAQVRVNRIPIHLLRGEQVMIPNKPGMVLGNGARRAWVLGGEAILNEIRIQRPYDRGPYPVHMLRISREQQPANGADPTGDIVEHCVPKLGNNGSLIYLVDEVFSDQRHGPPHDHNHVCALARSLRSPSSRQSYRVLTATSQASLPFLGSPRLRQQTGRLSARLKRRFQRSAGLLANATD